ncbi:hypothetical protein ACWD4F_41665 [Streptomyces aureus]
MTGPAPLMIGAFTAQNSGDLDLRVTATAGPPAGLAGKVTAEVRQTGGTAVLKPGGSARYELWLTPVKPGDTVSKDLAGSIHLVLASTVV